MILTSLTTRKAGNLLFLAHSHPPIPNIMEDIITKDIRQRIEHRIRNLKTLLLERLTPLLREQIRHAIALHTEALEHPNVDQYLDDLDSLHDQLMEHWTKVYGDLISRAYLIQDVVLFQQFLVAKLLEDYTNEPYTVDKWVLNQAKRAIEHEDHARLKDGSDVDMMYQVHVVFPLEEMMLSRDHVENKLRAAAIGREHPRSDIQPLIDRRDWSNLAAALTNDRHLALKLFGGPSFDTNILNDSTQKRILRTIDEIKGKYFSELSDSSTFAISTYAREMSTRHTSNDTNHGSPLTPLTIAPLETRNHLKDPSKNGFVWGIYDTIASGLGRKSNLKFRASLPSSGSDRDDLKKHE